MSLEDGVRDLVVRHADYLNLGQSKNFAANFTSSGVWDIDGVAKPTGRTEIQQMMENLRTRFAWVVQGVQGTRIVSHTSGTAKARSYIVEYGQLRGQPHFLFGCYHDDCVLTDDVWYFQYRKFHPLYMGSTDLDAPMVNYPAPDLF